MDRREMQRRMQDAWEPWEVLIVGGGATGLGTAVEAAARGYRTLLLEQHDFAKGTSSRSTKLVHGGVRYLQQGNISLVLEALRERGRLQKNAPHLVHSRPFVVPNYDWWEGPYYGIGLKLYDLMSGKQGFGRSRYLTKEETLEHIPTIEPDGLIGGVVYYDGQFDDARLAINLAQTAVDQGGVVLNYMRVTGLIKESSEVRGVIAEDQETGERQEIRARVVINATGVFADSLRRMDDPDAPSMIRPSQGVHLVLDRSFLPGDSAIMVPRTEDGRVLFAVPWHDRIIVGTTDTPVEEADLEPKAQQQEVEFLLQHARQYLVRNPTPADVKSVFAGLRPLVTSGTGEDTSSLARDHTLHISSSGLVTIAGGKWTTYRRMAQDTVDQAASLAMVEEKPSMTKTLRIHGYHPEPERLGDLKQYGSDASALEELMAEKEAYRKKLHPSRPVRAGEVVWAVRHEMARTVEDVLARRTGTLMLDARAAVEMAPKVARLMREEMGRGSEWAQSQVAAFRALAADYLLKT